MHLGMVRSFPGAFSWVPRRRRGQVSHTQNGAVDTLVLSRNEAAFYAWRGRTVPAGDRSRFAYLASAEDLVGFRGRVLVLPGAWTREDVTTLVEAIEPRVQCGMMSWAA